jgi:lysophospholipase L1-like esterase
MRRSIRDTALILVITILMIEFALRIYNPIYVPVRADRIELPVNRVFKQRNVNNPKVDEFLVVAYNSIGLRGPEFPADPDQYIKIITVGGSTTACVTLTDGRTWPDRLRSKLEESFKNVWLNNAGIDGHSTFGHMVLLETHLAKLTPDYVLYLAGINDVGREDLNRYDVAMIGTNRSLRDRLIAASEVFSTAQVIKRSLRAYDMGLNHSPPLVFDEIPRVDLDPADRERALREHREKYLAAFRERVSALLRRTRAIGAEPVLITQPALYGDIVDPATSVELGSLETPRDGLPASVEWEILELYNEVVRTVSREHDVFLIDLAAELPKDSSYFFDWMHYSNEGAVTVGDMINRALEPFLRERLEGNRNL